MTNHKQLLALKEALPKNVWPPQLERVLGEGFVYSQFPGYNDCNGETMKDSDALDIVTAHAERWLLKNGWDICKYHQGGRCWDKDGGPTKGSLVDAVKWEIKCHTDSKY